METKLLQLRSKRRKTSSSGMNGRPANTNGNATNCKTSRIDTQIENFDPVTGRFQRLKSVNIWQTAECRLKCEVALFGGQAIEFLQEQTTGRAVGDLRFEWREAAGDQVGVDEMHDPGVPLQVFASEGGFAYAVRSCDDDAFRRRSRTPTYRANLKQRSSTARASVVRRTRSRRDRPRIAASLNRTAMDDRFEPRFSRG
jgi:hypothetical protein